MTEQEAYAKGLEKLGLWKSGTHTVYWPSLPSDPGPYEPPDLRQDPAFAWRVEEQLAIQAECQSLYWSYLGVHGWCLTLDDCHKQRDFTYTTRADALYACIVALGREQE